MKIYAKALCVLALSCASSLALAQTGAGWERVLIPHLPGMTSRHADLIQVTSDQRMDLKNCMAATKQVEQIVNQMARIGSPWSRGRVNYSRRDLMVLAQREQELYAALNTLTTVHEELRNSLAEVRDPAIAKRLNKLDRLEAKLHSGSAQIGHDLASARPGPWSHEVSWDVDAVRNTANKWQAEHKQIAREMDSRCEPN